ncbi:MAG: hypothetical protein ACFB01_14775 [Cohaesibacteraceae bacterium]
MTDKQAAKPFGQAATPITTKERLDALKAARPKPTPERHLTPGGTVETETKRSVNSVLEACIAAMTMRLDRARQNLKDGRSKALARGKATAGFGRSR